MPRPNRTLRAAPLILVLMAVAALIVIAAGPALRNLFTPPAEQFRREGDAFLAEGRLPEAVLSYRQALSANPSDPSTARALAEAYTRQGRLRLATVIAGSFAASPAEEALALPLPDPAASLAPAWIIRPTLAVPTGAMLSAGRLYITYENGGLAAIDLPNGSLAWQVQVSAHILSPPEAAGGLVFIGDEAGRLHALSTADGSPAWHFDSGTPLYAAPLVVGEHLYLPGGDGVLSALAAADGALLWQFASQGALHSQPAYADGVLFFGSNDGKLYALDAGSGAPVWQDGFQTNGAVETHPLIQDGRVVFGSSDGRVYSLAVESGGLYWRFSTPDAVYAAPLADGEVIYIASTGHTLSAVDFTSGTRRWESEPATALRHPPVLHNSRLYLLAEADPHLYVLDAASGQVLAAVPTGDWTAGGPWLLDGMLYLLGRDGALLAYRLN